MLPTEFLSSFHREQTAVHKYGMLDFYFCGNELPQTESLYHFKFLENLA